MVKMKENYLHTLKTKPPLCNSLHNVLHDEEKNGEKC